MQFGSSSQDLISLNDRRIIGRKRKRNALSHQQDENSNESSNMNGGLPILPPNKRLKTSILPKDNNNNNNGINGVTRVFGSNLTNQNPYYLRSRMQQIQGINGNSKQVLKQSKNNKQVKQPKQIKQMKQTKQIKQLKQLKQLKQVKQPLQQIKQFEKEIPKNVNKNKNIIKLKKQQHNNVEDINIENKDVSSDDDNDNDNDNEEEEEEEDIDIEIENNNNDNKKKEEEEKLLLSSKYGEWDLINITNDLECVEYCNDIMKHLRIYEMKYCNFENYNFMNLQKDITDKMRLILLDWICGVHRKFRLVPQVFYLTINLLDRYLSMKQIDRNNLQLLGCACLWISSKYHEIYAPECSDFVYISDGAFTKDDLLKMEINIMVALSFELTIPTPMTFAQRFIKIGTFVIEKQFIKFAQIMFDRYLSQTILNKNNNTNNDDNNNNKEKENINNNDKEIKDMYIKGICELLNNGFNRSVSKFGANCCNSNINNNNNNKKKYKFGLSSGIQGIKTDTIDHIGNVLTMCDVIKHCKNTISKSTTNDKNTNNNNSRNNNNNNNIDKSQQLLLKVKKELKNKYGIINDDGIEHIIAIKRQMQDVLEKMDILCHLTYYLIEHGLLDYHGGLSRILPSKLAAASLAYALLGCGILNDWPKYLIDETGYKLNQLLPIMKRLDNVRQNKKHKSIQSKYNRQQYGKVAQLNFQRMNLKKYFNNN